MGKRARKRAAKLSEGADDAPVSTAVAPLVCPKCGAPVPLADGDVATCGFCQTAVPMPADYRALRAAQQEQTADRQAADVLYRKLGTEPSRALRAWSSVAAFAGGTLGMIVIGLIYVSGALVFLAGFALEIVLHWLAPLFGIDLIDRFGGGTVYAAFVIFGALFGLLPNWLVHYFDTSAEIRRTLQANLAARPPEKPGFPSTCRVCGAALDVPAGALGVRCAYCQADNLVALPASWVKSSTGRQKGFHRSIVDAAARAASLRADARKVLPTAATWCVGIAIVFGLLGRGCVALDREHEITTFGHSMGPPRTMTSIIDKPYELPADQLVTLDNYSPYTVALHHGETLEVKSPDACDVRTKIANTTTFPLVATERELPWGMLADGSYGFDFTAPYTGLFEVSFLGIDTPQHLRWSIGASRGERPAPAPALRVEPLAAAPPPEPMADDAQARVATLKAHLAARGAARPDLLLTSGSAAGPNTVVELTSVATGKELTTDVESAPIVALALASDGHRAVVVTRQGLFAYGIPDSVRPLASLGTTCGVGTVTAAAFITQHVAVTGDDHGVVRAYDADRGVELYPLATVPGAVTSLAASADGTALVVGYAGGAQRLVAASADAWSPRRAAPSPPAPR